MIYFLITPKKGNWTVTESIKYPHLCSRTRQNQMGSIHSGESFGRLQFHITFSNQSQ